MADENPTETDETTPEELLEDDEVSPEEEGFMKGYEEDEDKEFDEGSEEE